MDPNRFYPVLPRAREISGEPDLDILELRTVIGTPLKNDITQWLVEQSPGRALFIDLRSVRAVTLSVAEELGPHLLRAVQSERTLEHRYPVYLLNAPEPAYTFARAFSGASLSGLTRMPTEAHLNGHMQVVHEGLDGRWVIIGDLSDQMAEIMQFVDRHGESGSRGTSSEDLKNLPFLASKSPAARSKRLTELYDRRLLAFSDNPKKPRERLFMPVWKLGASPSES